GARQGYSIAIRTFITNDYMTGRPALIGREIPLETIEGLVEKIESRFREVDLILYDVTGKPPATVEWE
ncbi:MAG TPA: GMP synthase (glutamine-hydrolyzing), partial [Spirochaetia bacterium]|nr:GMP synthase (glutamine-hydrolyzing) [Spirochaetia bacterium]